jgi:hypothetical protein
MHAGHFRPLGIEGWRFAFLTVAAVSALIGVATFLLAHDPRFKDDSTPRYKGHGHAGGVSARGVWHEVADIIAVPTFLIIILQVRGFLGV